VLYALDANGNTATKTDSTGTTTYSWDFDNRLTSATLPGGGGTVSYRYDPFGRRIEKISPTATSIFAYDNNNVVETVNAGGGVVARYSQGPSIDEPLAMLRGTTTDYYEADGLGSVTSLTDATGALQQSYTYDSFGNTVATTGALRNYFQYTGREFDTESNLYFYRARYYDPQSGRFITEDPIGFNGGLNFYPYTRNSPVNLVDPSGRVIVVVGDITTWITATLYLNGSSSAASILNELQNAPEIYTINISDSYLHDEAVDGKTVYWNPHQALCVQKGVQSPAIQLLHELEHLRQDRHHQGGNLEESAVAATNPASMQLGEPIRLNYHDARGNVTWPLPIPPGSSCGCQK
jgi:RHS repeat-associated protein